VSGEARVFCVWIGIERRTRKHREFQNNARMVILTYERNLQTINKSFSKVDGVAEKEIEKLLKELEANFKYMIKFPRKSADARLKDYQKMIDEEGKQLERKYYGRILS